MKIRLLIILFILPGVYLNAQEPGESLLEQNFKNPPPSAKPRTWYHVMSGNMSKVGLTKDLEAMHNAGIGGLILFNITHFIPKGDVKFNSKEHIEMIAHAAAECERLGLSFGIHNCDGWRNSGGPWVPPEHSMKQVVHSEVLVDGGDLDIHLPEPAVREAYYEDIAVLAYPSLISEMDDAALKPVISSSDQECNVDLVWDGKADVMTKLRGSVQERAWIQFDYGKPKTIRSVYINLNKRIGDKGRTWLLTSADGKNFVRAKELKMLRLGKLENGFDDVFEPITAPCFRIETEVEYDLTEMRLSATRHYENWLARTSLFQREDAQLQAIEQPGESMIINKDDVIELSAGFSNNGRLVCTLAPGKWTIMRFGFTSTGARNGPASTEGTGLEADKMSKESFRVFYEGYVRNVINAAKEVAPNAFQYIEIDSYEVGGQNWTRGYEKYFREKYGYDLKKFLPLYAGRYIESAEVTDDVLWDIRNLNSNLITENYFGYFSELCHEDGLYSYAEPYSFNGPFNELDAGGKVDVPMGEFWMHQRYQTETAVSSGRIYGKPIISAEAFPAQADINWRSHPGFMKSSGDKAWTLGINEFMFHRFVHQANTHVRPGMTMSQWGSHIDRTQTWWDTAGKAWFRYIARGQYMLRQGKPVSDLLIFVGDGSPNSIVKRSSFNPEIPHQLNFDCINADALINRIETKNGQLVLPDGLSYKALVLYNTKNIGLPTLRKVKEIAEQGVVVIGKKPGAPGGYNISGADRSEFQKLVKAIWDKGTSYSHNNWDEIYQANNFPIDLKIENGEDINYIHRRSPLEDYYFFYNPDALARTFKCAFHVAGRIPELWNPVNGEISRLPVFTVKDAITTAHIDMPANGAVFIVFRKPSHETKTIEKFETNGKTSPHFDIDGQNQLRMTVFENGEYKIDFHSGEQRRIMVENLVENIHLNRPWKVQFQKSYGLDTTLVFKDLIDWRNYSLDEVKYYSGTATYTTEFDLDEKQMDDQLMLSLELGEVSVSARVLVNNEEVGILWTKPFSIDVTGFVEKGANELAIEITNTWTNRLIGDENYPNETGYDVKMERMPAWYKNNELPNLGQRKTFSAFPFYNQGDPLEASGLLGPVRISFSKEIIIN